MRHRPTTRGFTIIETLLFLLVSSFVFTAAISQYTAQQHTVAFNQGVRGLQADLMTLISEVSSSNVPDLSHYGCSTADAYGGQVSFAPYSPSPVINNSSCIFLGKAFAFGGPGSSPDCNEETIDSCSHYVEIPIVGRRQIRADTIRPIESLAEAAPLALASCTSGGSYLTELPCGTVPPGWPSRPDFAKRGTLSQGVGIYRAFTRKEDGDVDKRIGGIAFLFNLSNTAYDSKDNTGTIDLAYLADSGNSPNNYRKNTEMKSVIAIEDLGGSGPSPLNPPYGIALCITDGFNKKAVITVGANTSKLDVQVEPSSKFAGGGCD